MDIYKIDATGLRCPQPVLKLAVEAPNLPEGTIVEISGDCPTFESDIKNWCDRKKKTVLSVKVEGTKKIIQVKL
ncbi:MAG: sulfurtransferase TusA family protein [Acidobacteriota bacterium]